MLQLIDWNDWTAIVLCVIWVPMVLTVHMLWTRFMRTDGNPEQLA